MTRVYLIRHAEAEGNIYRRAQGHYDGAVSAKGQRQIAALAERFRDERIDAVYSSDLARTRATAGAILRYHPLQLHTDARLRELYLGPWEDQPFGDLQYRDPEQLHNFNDDPAAWRVPGAESFAALTQRMRAAVTDIAARHDGQTVVCVSHGMAIRALTADILAVPSSEIALVPHGDNTAVTLLEAEGETLRVLYACDTKHLPPELSTFARQTWWRQSGAKDMNNVRFERLDPERYPRVYTDFYRRTWQDVHGDLEGFFPGVYLDAAKRHVLADPDALVCILRPDGERVGITELDTLRGAEEGLGWICLCYIEPQYRRMQLGAQLIGHAVSRFRALGRRAVRLSVYEGNTGALRFYEEYGFRTVGETEGVSTRLLVLEKEL
ncbi:MAG: GNAT family N-acetyltransferase [Ruminococcaceae bacterium]|nr:GNAT family N-acetyltransferase [Oscillospiraceae bacterium]